ncbi:hypothetical protein BGW80DRAFT_852566 [Lactifluus volemus]|nr:hypothetical protein BGW80DRAFT_852566 [Lactifluus volemus]
MLGLPQGAIPMNQPFLSQQHSQSAPAQPHNMNLIPGPNQAMNFLPNAHSSNGPFPSNHPLSRIRSDNRQREMLAQSQRATAGGAQTGPSVINGVVPAQPSGVGYPGMGSQNGQGPQRVATQPALPVACQLNVQGLSLSPNRTWACELISPPYLVNLLLVHRL